MTTLRSLARSFWFPAVLTLAVLGLTGILAGPASLFICLVLVVLEVTFSFDNAVVNAKVLVHMSRFWQMLFLTVGIFIAVFVVRFALPIFIVQLTAGLGFTEVATMALNDPAQYGRELHEAGPMIDAFGGAFLLMIALDFFFDNTKDVHWLPFEHKLAAAGRLDNLGIMAGLCVALTIYFTVDPAMRTQVFLAAVLGVVLHMALNMFSSLFEKDEDEMSVKEKVGMAAFASFLYLEVLDASFSFDGVIGAFAITNSVLIIVSGLAAGAFWVRSMTVHLVKSGTLGKFAYLEHGAFWAILALGIVMILKVYHIELPEVLVGSLGLIFIGLSVWWSIRENKKNDEVQQELVNA